MKDDTPPTVALAGPEVEWFRTDSGIPPKALGSARLFRQRMDQCGHLNREHNDPTTMKPNEKLPLKPDEIAALPTLDELESLPRKALLELFKQLHRHHAPAKCSRKFLVGHCAWGIQAVQHGRDPMAWRKELIEKLETAFGKGPTDPLKRYKPGTRLIREWQGKVHEVLITEKGFLWKDNHYKSLSPIATAITGARWSGPRFFGIDTKPKINGRKQQRLEREARAQ